MTFLGIITLIIIGVFLLIFGVVSKKKRIVQLGMIPLIIGLVQILYLLLIC